MRHLSLLCGLCSKTLDSSLTDRTVYKPHHETLESFQNAILQGCYICSTMWKGFNKKLRDVWMENGAAWHPLQYRVYKEPSEEGLVKLSILYLDPIINSVTDTRFRMIISDGEP